MDLGSSSQMSTENQNVVVRTHSNTHEGHRPNNLIKNRKDWIPDESAAHCTNCYKEFNFFIRKHHCRICGQVFCKDCSFSKLLEYQNEKKNMRVCTRCDEMYGQFQNDLALNKPLLAGSNEFLGIKLPESLANKKVLFQDTNQKKNEKSTREEQKTLYEVVHFGEVDQKGDNHSSAYESRQSIFPQEEYVASKITEFGRETIKVNQFMKELNHEHQERKRTQRRLTETQKTLQHGLDLYLETHLKQIVDTVIDEFQIDKEKWNELLHDYMSTAVKSIQPSSRLLNDSIDINKFIKIFPLEWKNQSKSEYVNGVVFTKNVAHKRMPVDIQNPKILLITNSLGYVNEEQGFMDIQSIIKQEEPYVQIIISKIKKVEPDLIFVEKDVSRLALDSLMAENKTIVTNVKSSVIRRIARLTQTIACPSTNLIDEKFAAGSCQHFYIEKVFEKKKGVQQANSQLINNETSLMYLNGCEQYLGCTIIISGPDKEELKTVKKALKKMITMARILYLEREYLNFIQIQLDHAVGTPYLIKKHLQRDFLVFQLVQYSKKNVDSDSHPSDQMNEAHLKKKLNMMCQQPQKLLVHFYNSKEDISLGHKIRDLAYTSISECFKCKDLKLNHIICYYHKQGYLEIRLKSEQHLKHEVEVIHYQLQNQNDILVHAYCNICKRIVISQQKMSNQIYEISFYKFLEQFFYNQDSNVNLPEAKCHHKVHQNFSYIFKMGPIKLMFSYCRQEVYSLELQKFKDIKTSLIARSPEYIREQKDLLFGNFTAATQYIEEQLKQLKKKLMKAMSNVNLTLSNQLKDAYQSLLGFMKKIKTENRNFKQLMLSSFPLLNFDTILQLKRIQKDIIIQFSHFLLLLREISALLTNEITKPITLAIKSNNTTNTSQNQSSAHETMGQSMYMEEVVLTQSNTRQTMNVNMKKDTIVTKEDQSIALTKKSGNTLTNNFQQSEFNAINHSIDSIPNFDLKFTDDPYLQDIFVDSPSIPLGYNKNCIQVDNLDCSTIIAFVLSSNLYLEGLIKINYMDLSNKVSNFREGASIDKSQVKDTDFLKQNEKLKIPEKYDIFNKHTSNHDIENELLNIDNYTFSFTFCNYGPPKNMNLKVYRNGNVTTELKHGNQIIIESQQFEDFKKIEADFPKVYYDELNQIKKEISNLRQNQQKVTKDQQTRQLLQKYEYKETSRQDIYEIQDMFQEKIEYQVKVFFPSQFEALRKLYAGSYENFIHSIFKSNHWHDNTGGKSKSKFFKSSDEKFVFKLVKINELKMFREMGLSYFEYLCKSFFHYCPTALAKILGAFKIKIRYINSNKTSRFCLIIMENILLDIDEENCVKYDLKGSKRKRYIVTKSKGQVLLDNNFLQDFNAKPIAMDYVMKRLQQIAISNDSFFLFKNSIVDYSMLAIIDTKRKLVRIGVIDYVQQWTIDKILESRFKKVFINAGGDPTIVDPDLYKKRFREAMNKYFVAIYSDESIQSLEDIFNKPKEEESN